WQATRLVLSVLLAACVLLICTSALTAYAQQGQIIDPDASAVNERKLLEQSRRIEGRTVLVNERAGVLMQPAGRTWRYFHAVVLRWRGVFVIPGSLLALGLAYWLIGRLRLTEGRSGARVLRFTGFERFAHWLTATSFVLLALTGLNITFGKVLLLPLIGPE